MLVDKIDLKAFIKSAEWRVVHVANLFSCAMDLVIKEVRTEIWTLSPKFADAFCVILHERMVKTSGAELMVDYFSIQNPAPLNKSSV